MNKNNYHSYFREHSKALFDQATEMVNQQNVLNLDKT